MVPQNKSGLSFVEGIFFELTYIVDKSKEKKEAGTFVNHLDIPCFEKGIRGTDMKNYQKDKQQQYVFNIMNSDNLCFIYYII